MIATDVDFTDDVVIMVVDDTVVVISDGVPHVILRLPFCSPLNQVI